jgi:arylsulfatase
MLPLRHALPRIFVGVLSLAWVGALPACSGAEEQTRERSERRPDVFLLVVDTLRRDHLSPYGYPRPTSPRLKQLAAEGVLLEDVTSQCSWTKPSMVSMMTGRYITVYRDTFEESATTMAESFRRAGYRTLGIIGNVLLSEAEGFDRGFDHYDANRIKDRAKRMGGPCRTIDMLLADLWGPLDDALRVEEGEERPPLFVCFHVMEPHNPYLPHKEYRKLLPVKEAPDMDPDGWLASEFDAADQRAPADDPGWEAAWGRMRGARVRYDREIRYTDDRLATLLAGLEVRGLLKKAIVAVAADHGESLWEHPALGVGEERGSASPTDYYHQEHGVFLYEGLIGTPLILWGAGLPAGLRVPNPVENVDLFPTLMELADIAPPAGLHGQSLVPLIRGEGWAKDTVHSYVLQHAAVREVATGLKLILPTERGLAQGAQASLYHLRDDPREHRNLIKERPEDAKRLRVLIQEWIARYPTQSSKPKLKDQQSLDDLKALGYAGD